MPARCRAPLTLVLSGLIDLRMLRPGFRSVSHAVGLLLAVWAAETPLGAQTACVTQPAGVADGSMHRHGQDRPHEHGASAHVCCNLCTIVGLVGSLSRPNVSALR